MPFFAEQIRQRLTEFAAKWGGYQGSERAEAQTFLNELLACYGVDRMEAGARFEEPTAGKFVDMVWPGVCLVEMKRPSEAGHLEHHRQQALGAYGWPASIAEDLSEANRYLLKLNREIAAGEVDYNSFGPG